MTCLHPVILPLSPHDRQLKGRALVEAQRRRAREALAQSCEASGIVLGELRKDARNAPLPFSNTYWSLSHKSRYASAVVAPTAVGLDLEEVRPRDRCLYRFVATPEEWALAPDRSWDSFFRFWTAKEAVLKAAGIGLVDRQQSRIHALLDEDTLLVEYAARLWPVRHFRFEGHLASLAHDAPATWRVEA